MPLVSVLIPVFDGATTLRCAVGDVLSQSVTDLEIIVIDDASTDDTVAVATALSRRDPRVRLVRAAENRGPGAARTLGLREANGDWIAVLDADDGWETDRLKRLITLADTGRFDAVADNLALIDPALRSCVGIAFPLGPEAIEVLTPERFLANTIPGGRVNLGWMKPVARRDFLLDHNISWPPLRHAEDMVFTMELLLAGARFGLLGWPGYRYTQRRGTVSGQPSEHSRTRRSATEQQRAVALIRSKAEKLTAVLDRRLSDMRDEITVTTHVLEAREAIAEGRLIRAARGAFSVLAHPRALRSCLAARYSAQGKSLR